MSQTSYSINSARAFRGMKADSRFDHVEGGLIAAEAIQLGLGVVKNIGEDNQCRLPAANQGKLVFDADIVTGNNIDLDINGDAITTVPFNSTHLITMGDLATEIASHADVGSCALDPADTSNRTLIVTANDGEDINLTSIAVTGGGSQANGTFTQGTRDVLEGLSTHVYSLIADQNTGIVEYAIDDPVNITRIGAIYVYAEEALTSDDPVYCRFLAGGAGEDPGQFRKDDDSGKAFLVSNVAYKETITAAGIVKLEINLP